MEVIYSALDGILPKDHNSWHGIFVWTEWRDRIDRCARRRAMEGRGSWDDLQNKKEIGPDHVVYAGDGSSDIHVMLHVNARDGFTIAVSESKHVSQIAQRTVLSTSALGVLAPILERIVGLNRQQIRKFLESHGFLIQEWDKVRTEWLTLRQSKPEDEEHVAGAGGARA